MWHYTTAVGLHGILTSQQLWATDILYLNDAEEFTGFFDQKLMPILKEGIRKAIKKASTTPDGLNHIEFYGSLEEAENKISEDMLNALRSTSLQFQAYVTSFCVPSNKNYDDGILSQWRGYGTDGGYAIVFDTSGLNKLLEEEEKEYFYSFAHWGDVDYFDGESDAYEEALEWESIIRETAANIAFEADSSIFEEKVSAFFQPILSLATRHKHGGFHEESEVRITAFTSTNDKPPEDAREVGDNRKKKTISFRPYNGMLVPYISLFERLNGNAARLPINKIIVGPHPDKLKRKKSVEKLLDQLEIEAIVVTSEIPYLGL